MNFINIANGILALQEYDLKEYRFIRIPSTACEQKRWAEILERLGSDFYMNAAAGNLCVIYDYSAKHQVPRSVWQGLEWIKFVLNLVWLDSIYKPQGRSEPALGYFMEQYKKLPKKVIKMLKYYKKFLNTDKLYIEAVTSKTNFDGRYDYHAGILEECGRFPQNYHYYIYSTVV